MKDKIYITEICAMSPGGNSIEEIYYEEFVYNKKEYKKINYIDNFNFYKQGYKMKTRIDKSSQLCIHLSMLLLGNGKYNENSESGLITISKFGCQKSKKLYFDQLTYLESKQFASPKDFIQSICNIPNSLATIECNIKGFSNHYVGDADASIVGLWQATYCLKNKIVDKMAIVSFDSFEENLIRNYVSNDLSNFKFCESVAGVRIEKESVDTKKQFKILGFGFATNESLDKAIYEAVNKALEDSGIGVEKVDFVINNIDLNFKLRESMENILEDCIYHSIPIMMFKPYIGEYFASTPFLELGIIKCLTNLKVPDNLYLNKTRKDDFFIRFQSIFLLLTLGENGIVNVICLQNCN